MKSAGRASECSEVGSGPGTRTHASLVSAQCHLLGMCHNSSLSETADIWLHILFWEPSLKKLHKFQLIDWLSHLPIVEMPKASLISQVSEEAHYLMPRQPCCQPHLSPLPSLPFLCSAELQDPDWVMTSPILTGIYPLRNASTHLQKLPPRGKRAGNCLIGRLCPCAVSSVGDGHTSRAGGQAGGLSGGPVS